jgi:alpha-galactosidase
MINADYTAAYPVNLGHLIRDMRQDLQVPKLPFVIGQMGVEGASPSAKTCFHAKKAVLKPSGH